MKIKIQQQDFDINQEVKEIKANNNVGAVVNFIGFVRDITYDKLDKMILEHYPKMSENALLKIAKQAQKRWNIDDVTIIHRIGSLSVNEQIVLVITTSKHRKDAFNACEFIMDYLKTEAPFWKKEYKQSGSTWVKSNQQDIKNKQKWF